MRAYRDLSLPSGLVVTTWYDRGTRSWVTQLLDAEGNQQGNAEYDGDRTGADYSRGMLAAKADREG